MNFKDTSTEAGLKFFHSVLKIKIENVWTVIIDCKKDVKTGTDPQIVYVKCHLFGTPQTWGIPSCYVWAQVGLAGDPATARRLQHRPSVMSGAFPEESQA